MFSKDRRGRKGNKFSFRRDAVIKSVRPRELICTIIPACLAFGRDCHHVTKNFRARDLLWRIGTALASVRMAFYSFRSRDRPLPETLFQVQGNPADRSSAAQCDLLGVCHQCAIIDNESSHPFCSVAGMLRETAQSSFHNMCDRFSSVLEEAPESRPSKVMAF